MCNFEGPNYVVLSSHVPSLVYYSHVSIIVVSFFVGLYILYKANHDLSGKIVSILLFNISFWTILSLFFWSSNRGDIIMTVWSLTLLVEPIIYICCYYLLQVLSSGQDIRFSEKILICITYLPVIVFLPTNFSLNGFDPNLCLSIEGPIALYYIYALEAIYTLLSLVYLISRITKNCSPQSRRKIILNGLGILLFLSIFGLGNIIGSFTNNWKIGEFGLLGMPIFIGFLLYNIVNFNLFEIRLIGRNIIVITLWILVGSLLAIRDFYISQIVLGVTFIISIILGIILIKSTRREIGHINQISNLANELKKANSSLSDKVAEQTVEIKRSYELERNARRELEKLNDTKNQFINIAQHNIRVPITRINNTLEEVISKNDRIGVIELKKHMEGARSSIDDLTRIADDFKDIAKLKVGSSILNIEKISLKETVEDVLNELELNIREMNISITYPEDDSSWPGINVDKNKIKDVLMVIIENGIRYNIRDGEISIITTTTNSEFIIVIKNTGIGITDEERTRINNRTFYRGEKSQEMNPKGMGIGLSVSRSIVEAHHGTLNISSKGRDFGAEITLILPINFLTYPLL